MLKRLSGLTFLITFSIAAVAQTTATTGTPAQPRRRNEPRPYTLKIENLTKVKLDTTQINAAFIATYPGFAAADGYRTKREVSMRVIDTAKNFTVKAMPGEIIVNSQWIKKRENFSAFQTKLEQALHQNWTSVDTVKKDEYQLVFINKNSAFNPVIQKELIDTYFKVFPLLVGTFNDKTTHDVVFVTDTAYKGVAEASGNRILFSTTYMNAHPTDIDIVTHEGMHLVQGYGYGAGPVWLTEGIADFIRYRYGVDNIGSKWMLPALTSKHNEKKYENSYRITARFFEWIDQKVKPGMIVQIDKELRNHTYTIDTWIKLSGKTLDELWDDYAKNPDLTLKYSGKERI
ncbi:basic secretory protein-like protein [Pedobacter duraquae]|uniref:Basic secretory peptidase family protein n=1 Tax=Pedobacter duraquae TaxID=425511 RepID=A0A4R6INP6_9SPHI|nr:basic secretory protein-like protein [Pedobacter duraquae]TDO23860.1 basic secretory peptidase family protein [Pedobacter duraquae]